MRSPHRRCCGKSQLGGGVSERGTGSKENQTIDEGTRTPQDRGRRVMFKKTVRGNGAATASDEGREGRKTTADVQRQEKKRKNIPAFRGDPFQNRAGNLGVLKGGMFRDQLFVAGYEEKGRLKERRKSTIYPPREVHALDDHRPSGRKTREHQLRVQSVSFLGGRAHVMVEGDWPASNHGSKGRIRKT